jgi:hypothetical protein
MSLKHAETAALDNNAILMARVAFAPAEPVAWSWNE